MTNISSLLLWRIIKLQLLPHCPRLIVMIPVSLQNSVLWFFCLTSLGLGSMFHSGICLCVGSAYASSVWAGWSGKFEAFDSENSFLFVSCFWLSHSEIHALSMDSSCLHFSAVYFQDPTFLVKNQLPEYSRHSIIVPALSQIVRENGMEASV